MKVSLLVSLVILGTIPLVAQAVIPKHVRYIRPPECNQSKYSCVLKVVDGVPFYCLKETRYRYKSARKKVRAYTQIKCVKRYPALVDPRDIAPPVSK